MARVKFIRGNQGKFLEDVIRRTGLTSEQAAKLCNVCGRTFRDWKRGKYQISYSALSKLCKASKIPIPKDIEVLKEFWSAEKTASLGGKRHFELYGAPGNIETRRKGGINSSRKFLLNPEWAKEKGLVARKKITYPDSEFECFSVPLMVGVNNIHIIAFKDNKQVDETSISVFRRSELSREYAIPPSGFSKNYFHMKDRSLCAPCHILKPGLFDKKPVDISAFPTKTLTNEFKTDTSASTCYSCHKALIAYPFVHEPASVWSCFSCHEDGAIPNYSVSKPYTRMCFSCHLKQKEEREVKKYFHGPYTTGICSICHNPHASDYPFMLMKSTWDLCVSCHMEKGSGKHILERYMFSAGVVFHPTRGAKDPLREGKEFTCASCHNPHASYSPKLWRWDVGSGFSLCKKCHNN